MFSVTFTNSASSCSISLTERDCGILAAPDMKEGELFCRAIGVYDAFSVAKGMAPGYECSCNVAKLKVLLSLLLSRVERDTELLSWDYDCNRESLQKAAERLPGMVFHVTDGEFALCRLSISQPCAANAAREIAAIDLRVETPVVRAICPDLKIKRRKATFKLPQVLKPLQEFLALTKDKELRVKHL